MNTNREINIEDLISSEGFTENYLILSIQHAIDMKKYKIVIELIDYSLSQMKITNKIRSSLLFRTLLQISDEIPEIVDINKIINYISVNYSMIIVYQTLR